RPSGEDREVAVHGRNVACGRIRFDRDRRPGLGPEFEHEFHFHRYSEGQSRYSDGDARTASGFAEDVEQQLRGAIDDARLVGEPVRAGDVAGCTHHAGNAVQRLGVGAHYSERLERTLAREAGALLERDASTE